MTNSPESGWIDRSAARSLIVAAFVGLVAMVPAGVATADDSTQRTRYLLLDSRIIESADNATLTVGKVRKHENNPLFAEDKPWEQRFDNLYANVIYDQEGKTYKCWYSPFIVDNSARGMTSAERKEPYRAPENREMAICYAISKEGLQWEKPALGVVEFDRSKQNNIVWRRLPGNTSHWKGPHGGGVFKDRRGPDPARRYKAIFKGEMISVGFSADGIHWDGVIPCPEANVAGDTHNNAFWAPTLNKYVGITRSWGDQYGRQVARTESDDFLKWSNSEVVLEGLEKNLQTYAMPVFYHAGVYLGLVAIHDQQADRVWTELTWSPDTKEWNRISPGVPLIANSETEMAYDWGCVYAAACPIFLEDEIRIYYGGSDGYHFGWRNGFFCLATLRPDGWAGYEQGQRNKPAVITTREIPYDGRPIRITADVDDGGSVTVSLVDPKGEQLNVAKTIAATVTDGRLRWSPKPAADRIRLRFEVINAKVYSFAIESRISGSRS